MASGRKKYTKDFKTDAVNLYRTSGKSMKEIAEELGLAENMLWRWNKDFDDENAFPGNGNPQEKELYELKKENAILREEREILKKAIAIFSGKQKL
jgi:transposase